MQAMTEDKIQVRAYELWEQEGRPYGRAEEFWFRATTELSSNCTVKKTKKSAAPKAAASTKAKAVAEPAAKPKKKVAAKKSN
jgi:hypothetical protein